MLLLVNLNGRAPIHRSTLVFISRESGEGAPLGFFPRACPPIVNGIQGICIEEWPSLYVLGITLKTFLPFQCQANWWPSFALPQSVVLESPSAQHRDLTTSCYPSKSPKPGSCCSHGEDCLRRQDLTSPCGKALWENQGCSWDDLWYFGSNIREVSTMLSVTKIAIGLQSRYHPEASALSNETRIQNSYAFMCLDRKRSHSPIQVFLL